MSDALGHARQLLARARDDAYVIARLGDEPAAPTWVLGFHAQQAVEKALKAVLTLRYDALDEDEPRLDRGALHRQVDGWLAWAHRFVEGGGA